MVEINAKLQRVLESEGGGKANTEKKFFFSWHQVERASLRKLSVCLFSVAEAWHWLCTEEKQRCK